MPEAGDTRNEISVIEPRPSNQAQAQRVEQMVREHFAGAWRLVRRYGLNAADADDVTQRAMIIASQRMDEILLGRERAYLYRTAVFLASKVHRDRRRHPQHSIEDRDEPPDSNLNPELLLDQRRARERLDEILAHLPEDLRIVFLLFELESFSQGEIATTLGIPQGTVSSRLRRARECFTERMKTLDGPTKRAGGLR